jgi:integrase
VYGARAGQLRTLRLDDVLWKKRQVRLPAHKRGKSILHTLTPQVAQAISRYLLDVRPEAPYREVFLRCRRPFTPLGASAITRVVYTRLRRAGIKTESKGAHIFRHAFATRLLRKRYPLKTIADLLGHHDFASVAIYTKVDEPALREIACPWPELL